MCNKFSISGGAEDENISGDCKIKLVGAGGNGFKSKVQPYSFVGTLRYKLMHIFIFFQCLLHVLTNI